MSDTPRTDEEEARMRSGGCPGIVSADFARQLEHELRLALQERDRWRMFAEQKMALRREIEVELGVEPAACSDEQVAVALDTIKKLKRDNLSLQDNIRRLEKLLEQV